MLAVVENELRKLSRHQMAEKDWNRTDVAKRANVSSNAVSRFFQGNFTLTANAKRILETLEIELIPQVKKEDPS